MMKKLLSAVALTVAFALPSAAATLSGTFTIDIRNFSDTASSGAGANVVTQANSAANAANFFAQASDVVIKYTGLINFSVLAAQNAPTTIAQFLNSAGGSYSVTGGDAAALNSQLSLGNFSTTTFFQIMGEFGSGDRGTITHDDGITLMQGSTVVASSAPPTSKKFTKFDPEAGAFTLYYAAANGNPSILNVATVPVPAAGFLLIGALGGLVALRRRKTA